MLHEGSFVAPIIRCLVSDPEFIKEVKENTLLVERLSKDESFVNCVSNRLRRSVLQHAFQYDVASTLLQKQSRQFNSFISGFLERKRIMTRLERVEEKADAINQFERNCKGC